MWSRFGGVSRSRPSAAASALFSGGLLKAIAVLEAASCTALMTASNMEGFGVVGEHGSDNDAVVSCGRRLTLDHLSGFFIGTNERTSASRPRSDIPFNESLIRR